MEIREEAAVKAVKDALAGSDRPAAVMTGEPAGAAMVHMLTAARNGSPGMPVYLVQPRGLNARRLKYMDKLRRLWALDARIVAGRGADDETTATALEAASSAGADVVFVTAEAPGNPHKGVKVINPLSGFTDDDALEYLRRHGLPDYPEGPDDADGDLETGPEDDEVAGKLRSLGYM